MPASNFQV